MKIFVDQLEEKMETSVAGSLGEIIGQLCDRKIPEDRVITRVRVNGQEVVEDENGLFPDMPGADIESLELHTEPSREMAFRGIADAKDYLERLTLGIEKTAELFRVGEDIRSHEHYALCMEGLNWFIQVLKGVQQIVGLDYQEILYDRVSVQSDIHGLEKVIRGMLDAQSNTDWVMLSDLLEYELVPILERWKETLPLIEKEARMRIGDANDEAAKRG